MSPSLKNQGYSGKAVGFNERTNDAGDGVRWNSVATKGTGFREPIYPEPTTVKTPIPATPVTDEEANAESPSPANVGPDLKSRVTTGINELLDKGEADAQMETLARKTFPTSWADRNRDALPNSKEVVERSTLGGFSREIPDKFRRGQKNPEIRVKWNPSIRGEEKDSTVVPAATEKPIEIKPTAKVSYGDGVAKTYKTATATAYNGREPGDKFGSTTAKKNPKGEFKAIEGQTVAVDGTDIPHGVWIEVLKKDGTTTQHYTSDTGADVKSRKASIARGNKNPVIDFFTTENDPKAVNAKIGNSVQYRILPKSEWPS